jgi:hypothetical protein
MGSKENRAGRIRKGSSNKGQSKEISVESLHLKIEQFLYFLRGVCIHIVFVG